MKKTSGDTVKTNAMRQLEVAGISYRTASYEYDESNLSGLHAAEQVGIPAEQVFKTLVTRGDKTGILVFCIPVDMELDLKKAAAVSGNKKLDKQQNNGHDKNDDDNFQEHAKNPGNLTGICHIQENTENIKRQ